MRFDTIVAPATPVGRSALGIVRLDGPQAFEITRALTGDADVPARRAVLSVLSHEGQRIDQSIVTRFAGPESFTGNDVVEFCHHGSPLLASLIVRACTALGARLAEPGEFTERAVLNGRLDLVQAEGIAGLIEARTTLQARLALGHIEGELSRASSRIRDRLLHVMSRLEGALDFAEEGYEFISRPAAIETCVVVGEELERMVATWDRGRATMEGLTLVLLGRPNAGKSTLLNALVGSDRAIVTEIPGTTRDLLREGIEIGGVPVTLIDTAGIRTTEDRIEGIGIERARAAARGADLVLYLVDSEIGLTLEDEIELGVFPEALVVWTKSDIGVPPADALAIAACRPGGVEPLLGRLEAEVRRRWRADESSPVLVTERQFRALAAGRDSVGAAESSLRNGASEEVVLVDLYAAASHLGALMGEIASGDVLGEIFSKFCIGK